MRCYKKDQRLLVGLLALIFSLLPEFSAALGLGPIKLYSYLNEPLEAEIELLDAQTEDVNHLMASLASNQDFKRAEIARPYYLNQLRFEIVQDRKRTFIKVTSDDSIKTPYLEFLTTLTWPGGKLVRTYTLLLDPASRDNIKKSLIEKQGKANLSKADKQAIIHLHEQPVDQSLQDKLSQVRLKPTLLAKADDSSSFDTDVVLEPAARNSVAQHLDNLFDAVDRQEVAQAPIQKSVPVAIEVPATEQTNRLALNNDDSSTRIIKKKVPFFDLNENSLWWARGLSLFLIAFFAVWLLKWTARERMLKSQFKRVTNPFKEEPPLQLQEEIIMKLTLAQQYLDIQDRESARELLEEIVTLGNKNAQDAAKALLKEIE
jgi:FimV-like protein